MATINIGRLKPVFQGAYDNAQGYVVDDIVTYSGETYICILASTGNVPTNTTYWSKMASKGADGVDADLFSISGTAQGDLYYNNGSAIARLGAGTSGQALITNGTGANPSWGDVGGGLLQIKRAEYTSLSSFNSSSGYAQFGTLQVTITPTANDSSFWINAVAYASPSNHDTPWKYNISDSQVGTTTPIFTDASRNHTGLSGNSHFGVGSFGAVNGPDDYWLPQTNVGGMYTPSSNNGNARTFRLICRNSPNGSLNLNETQINNNSQAMGGVSTIEVWEIANGIYS